MAETDFKAKAGDWITAPGIIFLRIVAALDTGNGYLYGVFSPTSPGGSNKNPLKWCTTYELADHGFKVIEEGPDFATWKTVQVGEIVSSTGFEDGEPVTQMRKVLARVDDLVCLSMTPDDPKDRDKKTQLKEQLAELEGSSMPGAAIVVDLLKPETKHLSHGEAFKIAMNEWYTVEQLAIFDWKIIRE